jgi:hypothetical protein
MGNGPMEPIIGEHHVLQVPAANVLNHGPSPLAAVVQNV